MASSNGLPSTNRTRSIGSISKSPLMDPAPGPELSNDPSLDSEIERGSKDSIRPVPVEQVSTSTKSGGTAFLSLAPSVGRPCYAGGTERSDATPFSRFLVLTAEQFWSNGDASAETEGKVSTVPAGLIAA